jgi:hypothetical protein
MMTEKPDGINSPFPVDALPKAVADICSEISNSFEVPIELPCTTALGLLAACCQKKAIVRINSSYSEQLNLFTLSISDTGDRKSNVFRLLRDAVITAQNEYFALNEDAIAQSRLEYKLLQKKLEAASRDMIYNEDSGFTLENIKSIEKQIRDFELLTAPKLLVDDATSEKLIDVLEEQGGSIAIASPEGGLFSALKTAASANPTFDAYLKAYTGDSIEVQRLSRKGNSVETPKLSLIIACQPKTAMEMIQNKTFRDKGLPARFLFANCRSFVGMRTFDKPEVHADAIGAYNILIHKLLEDVFSRDSELTELTLTTEGRTAYIQFSQGIEAKLGNDGELKFMQDWCAKLPGQMLRIAGIIAVCDEKCQIDADIIKRASTIAAWFMENAITVFGEETVVTGEFSAAILSQFLFKCTEKGSSVKTTELLKHYNEWALERGYEPTESREFVGKLRKKLNVIHSSKGNIAKGIILKG